MEAGQPAGGAVFVDGEQALRPVYVAVDLPQAAVFAAGGALFDEAAHVLYGVAEEEADLVGEIPARAQAAH